MRRLYRALRQTAEPRLESDPGSLNPIRRPGLGQAPDCVHQTGGRRSTPRQGRRLRKADSSEPPPRRNPQDVELGNRERHLLELTLRPGSGSGERGLEGPRFVRGRARRHTRLPRRNRNPLMHVRSRGEILRNVLLVLHHFLEPPFRRLAFRVQLCQRLRVVD